MWAGLLEMSRNPIPLVKNKGATRKIRKARSLATEQFHALLKELHEPFATMALLCVCLGLRISEALALQWSDVDWLGSRLSIRRGILERVVDDVKTEGSAKTFNLAILRANCWTVSSLVNSFRNFRELRTGFLQARSNTAGCHTPTRECGVSLCELRNWQKSGTLGHTHSDTPTARGLTPWALPWPYSKR